MKIGSTVFKYLYDRIIILIFPAFILLASINIMKAQPSEFDTKGRDFWFTYLPNFHNEISNPDSLYIFITADQPTSGNITYRDSMGTVYNTSFTISNPEEMYIFQIRFKDYYFNPYFELQGYNVSGKRWYTNQCERVAKQSFHITSDNDITVYALNQAIMTSDAFLVLPTNVLGTNHLVMAYYSDDREAFSLSRTPSQFAVVATEDNTEILIKPSVATYIYGMNEQRVLLNQGDVYLVQARITGSFNFPDLTGSIVTSTKPVAVFGGQQRATIPVKEISASGDPSRDCLIEQIPPLNTWGKNAFIVPYNQPDNIIANEDIFRIMAAYDGTVIYIEDVEVALLDAGEVFEGVIQGPAHVSSNNAILVAQYKRTSGLNNIERLGDPFMMIMPPKEQFKKSYRIINIQVKDGGSVYKLQYVNIIAPTSAISTIKIDGKSVNGGFVQITNTEYSYANIPVSDGVHYIESDEPIGVFVYGYGYANSYGYVGGMSMKSFDFKPPEINLSSSCFTIDGIITDSARFDTRIKEVSVQQGSLENVEVNIDRFSPGDKAVHFSASLINTRQDGKFTITAVDSGGTIATKEIEIPGVTISFEGVDNPNSIPEYIYKGRVDHNYCYSFKIRNYGKFPQNINKVTLKNNIEFSIVQPYPLEIMPGESKEYVFCFNTAAEGVFTDTMYVFGRCDEFSAIALKFEVVIDRFKPEISAIGSDCDTLQKLTITDSSAINSGIRSVNIKDNRNFKVNIDTNSVSISAISFSIIDPYQDAFLEVEVIDSLGNISIYRDSVPGFTVELPELASMGNILAMGRQSIGSTLCDNVMLHNYGNFPISIDDPYLFGNTTFSIPQAQFPITLNPGSNKELMVCFNPVYATETDVIDTLRLFYRCFTVDIILKGTGEPNIIQANSRCEVPVELKISTVPRSYFLDGSIPSPAISSSRILFGLAEKGKAVITLYDIFGNVTKVVADSDLRAGIYEVTVDVSDLPKGVYYYDLRVNGRRLTNTLVVSE